MRLWGLGRGWALRGRLREHKRMKERYRFLKYYMNCPAGHQREGNHPRGTLFILYQIYVELDVLALSKISSVRGANCTTAKKLYNCRKFVQLQKQLYNCKINGTTAKLYVGIIQEISTAAKNGTTAKKIAQLQKQMHNCKNKCTTAKHIYCSCGQSYYLFPCSHATQQWPS